MSTTTTAEERRAEEFVRGIMAKGTAQKAFNLGDRDLDDGELEKLCYLAGRSSLVTPLLEAIAALERIVARNGFCIMGPPSDERDEMIAALNGDYEAIVHRSFELGSARTNADCAAEARTCLEKITQSLSTEKEPHGTSSDK